MIKVENSSGKFTQAMQRLLMAVQDLSLARDLETIIKIVREAARELTGADGATFVLRDGDLCYYVDENAIGPLWKGKRFPMQICISGWAMLNKQAAIIEDIYQDPRIPIDAYRPTFVKSLAMVPIRTVAPIGAIGNYWAKQHLPTREEVSLLQALADSTSIAMENVQLYLELEQRVKDRTQELELANKELEAFSYSVSHDLRSPLMIIKGFSDSLMKNYAVKLDDHAKKYLGGIGSSVHKMSLLIEDLIKLSKVSLAEIHPKNNNLSLMVEEICADIADKTHITIAENVFAFGDTGLLRIALENLLQNAIKYSSNRPSPQIEFGVMPAKENKSLTFFVRDNGIGFSMQEADQLFKPFQRLSNAKSFAGTGIGLATTARIVERHNGKIWAESEKDKGTTFYITLPS